MAIPHYSPGYTGWDISEQHALFDLLVRGARQAFPEPVEVLSSGMLRPKKSLLAVIGLAPRSAQNEALAARTPCESCGLSPCRYRRAPYRHAPAPETTRTAEPLTRGARYGVSTRALQKWAGERVSIVERGDGSLEARFRFDGTTCSNMGQPLAFDYRFELSGPGEGYVIRDAVCRPAEGDEGYKAMCAYLSSGDALLEEIAAEKPLLGRPLDEVLRWQRASAPSGCYCSPASREHKWGLALEAIHYALVQAAAKNEAG